MVIKWVLNILKFSIGHLVGKMRVKGRKWSYLNIFLVKIYSKRYKRMLKFGYHKEALKEEYMTCLSLYSFYCLYCEERLGFSPMSFGIYSFYPWETSFLRFGLFFGKKTKKIGFFLFFHVSIRYISFFTIFVGNFFLINMSYVSF